MFSNVGLCSRPVSQMLGVNCCSLGGVSCSTPAWSPWSPKEIKENHGKPSNTKENQGNAWNTEGNHQPPRKRRKATGNQGQPRKSQSNHGNQGKIKGHQAETKGNQGKSKNIRANQRRLGNTKKPNEHPCLLSKNTAWARTCRTMHHGPFRDIFGHTNGAQHV